VTPSRRVVRATPDFFHDLDHQLGTERGHNGEPSANDFQVLDLLRIVERFATEFDALPELIHGRRDYRVLVGTGFVVAGYLVVGQLASDGAVELIALEIDAELESD
jgi:hypothetical protein